MVLIPKDNEKDLTEVPRNVQNAMKIVFVDHIDEVLEIALVKEDDLFGNTVGNEVQADSCAVK